MSTLEATAKPMLMPMAAGESVWLGESEQANLSLWALKTALMFKSLEIRSPSFNLGLYKTLYSHLPEPLPRGAYVSLGRFDPSVTSGHYRNRDLFPAEQGVTGPAPVFIAALVPGRR